MGFHPRGKADRVFNLLEIKMNSFPNRLEVGVLLMAQAVIA